MIHKDQTAFIPKWKLTLNIRSIIDILEYYETHLEKQMMLIFLQKAFDNVNWVFMLFQLKKIGAEGKIFTSN